MLLLSALECYRSWIKHLVEAFFLYLGVLPNFVRQQIVLPASSDARIDISLMWSFLRARNFQLTSFIRWVICYEFPVNKHTEAAWVVNSSWWFCIFFILKILPLAPLIYAYLKSWLFIFKLLKQTSQIMLSIWSIKVNDDIHAGVYFFILLTARSVGWVGNHLIILLYDVFFDSSGQSAPWWLVLFALASPWI